MSQHYKYKCMLVSLLKLESLESGMSYMLLQEVGDLKCFG